MTDARDYCGPDEHDEVKPPAEKKPHAAPGAGSDFTELREALKQDKVEDRKAKLESIIWKYEMQIESLEACLGSSSKYIRYDASETIRVTTQTIPTLLSRIEECEKHLVDADAEAAAIETVIQTTKHEECVRLR